MDEQKQPREMEPLTRQTETQGQPGGAEQLEDLTPEQAELVMEGGDLQPCEPTEVCEPPEEDMLCEHCAEREKDNGAQPDYPFCSECRKTMLRQKIGWEAVVMAAVFFLFSAFAAVLLVAQWPIISASVKGEYYNMRHRYVDAHQEFSSISGMASNINSAKLGNRQLVTDGYKSEIRVMRMYAKATSTLGAGYYAKQRFTQEQLDSFLYRQMNRYVQEYDNYYELMTELFGPYQESMGENFQLADLPYAEIVTKTKEMAQKKPQNAVYALYIRAMVAQVTGQNEQDCLAVFQELETLAPKRLDLYVSEIIELYQKMGETKKALVYCDKLERHNRNDDLPYRVRASILLQAQDDSGAQDVIDRAAKNNPASAVRYELQMELLRRQKKYEEAMKTCEEAAAAQLNSGELYRQQIIVYLLQEKYDEAYSTASSIVSSYESQGQNAPEKMLYVWAISASVAKDGKEAFADWKKNIVDAGYSVPERMQSFLDGKMTIADLFLSGEGDVL